MDDTKRNGSILVKALRLRLAFKHTRSLSFDGLILFLLSFIICPVLEKILFEGTDVAMMHVDVPSQV